MAKRQHFKGKKRMKSWHRGQSEARRWRGSDLPDLGTGADPTAGEPAPLHHRRRTGKQQPRGEAV